MAPMPSIKSSTATATSANYLFATPDSGDNSPTPSSPPSSTDPGKSQCSSLSDGESFEGYGENELGSIHLSHHSGHEDHVDHALSSTDANGNLNGSSGVELDLAPHGNSSTPQQ